MGKGGGSGKDLKPRSRRRKTDDERQKPREDKETKRLIASGQGEQPPQATLGHHTVSQLMQQKESENAQESRLLYKEVGKLRKQIHNGHDVQGVQEQVHTLLEQRKV